MLNINWFRTVLAYLSWRQVEPWVVCSSILAHASHLLPSCFECPIWYPDHVNQHLQKRVFNNLEINLFSEHNSMIWTGTSHQIHKISCCQLRCKKRNVKWSKPTKKNVSLPSLHKSTKPMIHILYLKKEKVLHISRFYWCVKRGKTGKKNMTLSAEPYPKLWDRYPLLCTTQ